MPLTAADKDYVARIGVRGHYREEGGIEDLDEHNTKPNPKMKRKMGGKVGIVAAIVGPKFKVFQFIIPKNKWNAHTANLFFKALRRFAWRHYPTKKTWKSIEDNDPCHKTKGNEAAKKSMGIEPIGLPPRSPDISPLDYSVWGEVLRLLRTQEENMEEKKESQKQFVARLQKTIGGLGKGFLRNTMRGMKGRLRKLHKVKGGLFEK